MSFKENFKTNASKNTIKKDTKNNGLSRSKVLSVSQILTRTT